VVQTLSWLHHRGHGESQRESKRTVPPVSFQVLSFLFSSVLEVFFGACVKLIKSSFKKRLLFPPQKGA